MRLRKNANNKWLSLVLYWNIRFLNKCDLFNFVFIGITISFTDVQQYIIKTSLFIKEKN